MGNKNSLSHYILLILEKAVDGYCRFEDFTYHHYRYHYGIPELKTSSLSLAIKRLRENGLIDFIDDEHLLIQLTDSGREKALWLKIISDNEKWDGKWRIVIWDIPEKRRAVRDLLRFKLKQLGFTRWQKSVWVSKKNCTKVLRDFIRQVGIKNWVKVIESDNIED